MEPVFAALQSVLEIVLHEVPDIVQQGGGDQVVRRAFVFGQLRALQCVLFLGDRFTAIESAALGCDHRTELVDHVALFAHRAGPLLCIDRCPVYCAGA